LADELQARTGKNIEIKLERGNGVEFYIYFINNRQSK
jgi:hypothetical protein